MSAPTAIAATSPRLTAADTCDASGMSRAQGRHDRWLVRLPLGLIWLYRKTISPLLQAALGPAAGCRFYPSCSCYAADALKAHGLLRGGTLALWRVVRCTPLSAGGLDPVPAPRARSLFRSVRPICTRA